eukprot:CAMPEP_0170212252 /NCGR_PEP_ID=MMETSP0116_2-20130129/5743_1 /TAXON_ID=400756 /ORGANISM="Durinskia baltica, Strain CSIRO CS-38" /LENGTH=244 /DNA_ID=CAMNT_0010462789 /DNA_START=501 /DNA_END=1233 /DNA_ORIENTATION=+
MACTRRGRWDDDAAIPVPLHVRLQSLVALTHNHLAHLVRANGPLREALQHGADLVHQRAVDHINEGVPEPTTAPKVHRRIHEVVSARKAGAVEHLQDRGARVVVRQVPQHERGSLAALLLPGPPFVMLAAGLALADGTRRAPIAESESSLTFAMVLQIDEVVGEPGWYSTQDARRQSRESEDDRRRPSPGTRSSSSTKSRNVDFTTNNGVRAGLQKHVVAGISGSALASRRRGMLGSPARTPCA